MVVSSFSSQSDDSDADPDEMPSKHHYYEEKRKSTTIEISWEMRRTILKRTAATANRYKISTRAHLALVVSTLDGIGVDLDEVNASPSTVKVHRKAAIKKIADEIREKFVEDMPDYMVAHWDGKITEFLGEHGYSYQDVNAVCVSAPGYFTDQFLGAPVMENGATGRALAEATIKVLADWSILTLSKIIALVFDTTASNSGKHEGAAKWIEEVLGVVLYNPCRYHIYELHIKHPFDKLFGATTGNCRTDYFINSHIFIKLYGI